MTSLPLLWNGHQAIGENGREYIMWPKHGHWHVVVMDMNNNDKIIGELTCEYEPTVLDAMAWAAEFEDTQRKALKG